MMLLWQHVSSCNANAVDRIMQYCEAVFAELRRPELRPSWPQLLPANDEAPQARILELHSGIETGLMISAPALICERRLINCHNLRYLYK